MAEVRIEKEKGQWKLYLTGIRFFVAEPVILASTNINSISKSDSVAAKSNPLPTITTIKPLSQRQTSILQRQLAADRARYKKSSRIWGVVALLSAIGTIATYYTLNKSYNDYKINVSNNDDYKHWLSLTKDRSLGASQLPQPLAFSEFARPGIYGVYLGSAATVLSCSFSLGKSIKSSK